MQELAPTLIAIGVNALAVALIVIAYALFAKAKEDDRYRVIVELVQAAEQMFNEPGEGKQRMDWVFGEIERRFPQLDTDLIISLVEAAVYRLNVQQATIRSFQGDE